MDTKKTLGGGLLVVAGGLLAKETVAWVWARFLDTLTAGMGGPVTWANFPWLNLLGLILMIGGLWLVFHKPENKLSVECAKLHLKMAAVYDRLGHIVSVSSPGYYPDILGELASIYRSLEDMRIPTPEVAGSSINDAYRQSHAFIGALMPMIRDNHIQFARAESPKIIKGVGAEASPLPPKWGRLRLPRFSRAEGAA